MTCPGPSYADLAAFCQKYAPDPDADRKVTAEIETAGDLAALLADQLRKVWALSPDRPMGWQELTCAADVAEALREVTREGDEMDQRPRVFVPLPAMLVDIPVIVSPDSAPGTWRLVTHDRCEIRTVADDPYKASVSHAGCTITAEGCLT